MKISASTGKGRFLVEMVRSFLIVTAAGTVGCAGTASLTPSQDVMDVIAVCNAGFDVTSSAGLEVDLARIAKGDLAAEARVSTQLVGQLAEKLEVTEEQAVDFYKQYVSCVQSRQSVGELVAILNRRSEVVEKNLTDKGYTDLLEQFRGLYPSYIRQLMAGQSVAAYDTYGAIQNVLITAARRSTPDGDVAREMKVRFNMAQSGKSMTAAEFDAWMKSRGVRVARAQSQGAEPEAESDAEEEKKATNP